MGTNNSKLQKGDYKTTSGIPVGERVSDMANVMKHLQRSIEEKDQAKVNDDSE